MAGLLSALPAGAGELSAEVRSVLLLRVLAYDRGLPARATGPGIPILLLEAAGDSASRAECAQFETALTQLGGKVTVAGRPVHVARAVFTDAAALGKALDTHKPAVLYVCVGMGPHLADVAGVTRQRRIPSATGQQPYVAAGLGFGLVEKDNRPRVVVNLPVCRAEGADFDAALLTLAEIIR
ncbi:MAG: YfiR family protein [Deltaproteobacteria bacterium]|nr:YfiR family protein [Deltaproteobacteria bacterium]